MSRVAVVVAAIALLVGFSAAAMALSSTDSEGDTDSDGTDPEVTSTACQPDNEVLPSGSNPSTDGGLTGLDVELVVDGLVDPVDVLQLPGWDLLLVAEKPGRIVAVRDGQILDPPVLDISDRVTSESNERGLVTIEADPQFVENCRLILFFTDLAGDSNLVSVTVDGTSFPHIDPDSMTTLLVVPQKQRYHQSGSVVFGPEGKLWVSIGDGGLGQQDNAQDPERLEGSVIRLDVGSAPYVAPANNPFGVQVSVPDTWSIGLRNPWRISIDSDTGIVYVPDTGFETTEEVNIAPMSRSGLNFGWPVTEGTECSSEPDCDTSPFTLPTYHHPRASGDCAIIGGDVYRGEAVPELHGHYFFGDFCSGNIRSFVYDDGSVSQVTSWSEDIEIGATMTSFGTDTAGEMYVTTLTGRLWKIVPERS